MSASASIAVFLIRRTAYVLAAVMLLAFVSVPAAFAQSAFQQTERSLVQEASAHFEADAAEHLPARSYLALRMQVLYPLNAPAVFRRLKGAAGLSFKLDIAAEDAGSERAANNNRTWLYVGGAAVALGITAAAGLLLGSGGGEGSGGEGGGIPLPPPRP